MFRSFATRVFGDPRACCPIVFTTLVVAGMFLCGPRHSACGAPWQADVVESFEVVDSGADSQKLSLRDSRADMIAFTRRLDSADTSAERIAAVVDLCGLYVAVIADPRFSSAQPLQGYRGRIANRLQEEAKRLRKQESESAPGSSESSASWSTEAKFVHAFSTEIVDPHWKLATHFAGGAGPVNYYASGLHGSSGHFLRDMNAGLMFDHGPELVALIEAMLHPDYWDTAGGEGKIHYYQPLRILVIRARTTVHEDIEAFLERLR